MFRVGHNQPGHGLGSDAEFLSFGLGPIRQLGELVKGKIWTARERSTTWAAVIRQVVWLADSRASSWLTATREFCWGARERVVSWRRK